MGRNMSEAGAAGEAGAEEYDDDVFVPHYGNYVHAATPTRNGHQPQQGSCLANKYGIRADLMLQVASAARRNSAAEDVSITQGLFSTRTFSPPPSVLRQIGAQQQPCKSGACGDSSSLSSIDNVNKKLGLASLHQKLSELQVALQASERAREEGQQETNALRVYLGNVEAAAASLVTRIQELQHLLALSSAVQQGQDVDQLRGKVATEATKEARNHAASAAQAISAAREATMELDKVKRDSYALTIAQAAEIERLCAETADYHTICEARGKKIQDLTVQLEMVQQQLEQQRHKLDEVHKMSQMELSICQKTYEAVKLAAKEKANQCADLMQALELSKATVRSGECKLEEAVSEKKDLLHQNELLIQQVKKLQNQEMEATMAHYTHELHKVRAVLGGEKANLLADLALLRQGNHTLQEGFLNWHEKSSTCPVYGEAITETSFHGSILKGDCNPSKDEVVKGRMCVPSNASPVGLSLTENSGSRDTVTESLYSLNSSCSRIDVIQHGGNPQESLSTSYEANGRCPALCHIMRKECRAITREGLEKSDTDRSEAQLALTDLKLLAAAQREIGKLKEINQQLVAACQ